MAFILTSLPVIVSMVWVNPAECADKPGAPNIIFILADDMGYGDPGCYNKDSKIPTPNIDRLAADGIRFTDAHTPSSVCTPTRYGLLTGRYCWRTRLKQGVFQGYDPLLIEPGRMTLASLLRSRGYVTGCVGKWHLGLGKTAPTDYTQPLRPGPGDTGFDYSFIIPASLDMPPYVFVENERCTEQPTEKIGDSKMRRYGGEGFWRGGAIAPGFKHIDVLPAFTRKAIEFIEKQAKESKPFFLYLPLNAPHTPWMPTSEYQGKSKVGWYGDFVIQTDATVGQVLDALDRLKLRENTIVIFTSDNGAHWLPSDIQQFGHRANGSWRGQKADVWEAGHRVPFIVRWPGRVRPGSTAPQTICLTDMLATFAEVVGEKLPDNSGEDSFSMLPVLLGKAGNRPIRDSVIHHSASGMFAIRAGDWVLIDGLGSGGFTPPRTEKPQPGGPAGQLYHLGDDPQQEKNRYQEQPEVVARLRSLLQKHKESGRTRP
jgi:arylsulfatase A-like enzyme